MRSVSKPAKHAKAFIVRANETTNMGLIGYLQRTTRGHKLSSCRNSFRYA